MIGFADAPFTYEYSDYYKILPMTMIGGMINLELRMEKSSDGFTYSSDNTSDWMQINELKNWIKQIQMISAKYDTLWKANN